MKSDFTAMAKSVRGAISAIQAWKHGRLDQPLLERARACCRLHVSGGSETAVLPSVNRQSSRIAANAAYGLGAFK